MATAKKNVVTMKQDIPAQLEILRGDIANLADSIKIQAQATVVDKTSAAKQMTTEKTELVKDRYDELTAAPIPPKLADDPLAKYIPENVRENPTMQKLLYQIGESPVTATATAVTLGMLISREFLEET